MVPARAGTGLHRGTPARGSRRASALGGRCGAARTTGARCRSGVRLQHRCGGGTGRLPARRAPRRDVRSVRGRLPTARRDGVPVLAATGRSARRTDARPFPWPRLLCRRSERRARPRHESGRTRGGTAGAGGSVDRARSSAARAGAHRHRRDPVAAARARLAPAAGARAPPARVDLMRSCRRSVRSTGSHPTLIKECCSCIASRVRSHCSPRSC